MKPTSSRSSHIEPVVGWAVSLLVLTAVHHAYGAVVYDTPFRLHGALVAVALCLPIAALYFAYRRFASPRPRRIAGWVLVGLVLAVPVVAVGLFEGAYNHALKNALYFGGVSEGALLRLFPPPVYELPNNAVVEVTGVAQAAFGWWGAIATLRFAGALRRGEPPSRTERLVPGSAVPAARFASVNAELVAVPDRLRLVHLQFRRFAGCPVCNLHLRTFTTRYHELLAAGILEVVVFHSSADELRLHTADLPFSVVADPDEHLYEQFAVESSPRALLDPRAWWPILRAVTHATIGLVRGTVRAPALRPAGGSLSLPADFLIDSDGRVIDCHYGQHVDDQWSVDEVLALAARREAPPRRARRRGPRSRSGATARARR